MKEMHDALDLAQLRVLSALLRERHLTRAALRLGLTQSAVSHSLRKLRETFGDDLFVRGPQGMLPTSKALGLAAEVEDVLERVSNLGVKHATFDPATLVRTFTIAAPDFAESVIVPRIMTLLLKSAPSVELVIRPMIAEDQLHEALGSGHLDFVLSRRVPGRPSWASTRLFSDTFVTILRKGHPALKKKMTPAVWAALPHALVAPRGLPGGPVDDALAQLGLKRNVHLRLSSFHAAPLLVAQTDLVVTLPKRIATAMAKGLRVTLIPTPVELHGFDVDLSWHERSRQDHAHAWLRREISKIAKSL